jgi:2-dehydro-3-deoxyphosphogluconate aldolase/(4S)-4-hydroxy-2-oxoglutarate aldolase
MFDEFAAGIRAIGMVPAVALDDEAAAVPLGRALVDGGVPIAEVTFRTPAAAACIRAMSAGVPDLVVGAGTVTSVGLAGEAVASGATFIVAPGLNPKVAAWCIERDVPFVPGVATPSEIESAMGLGLDTLKFFPAEANGGIAALKALGGPYKQVRFLPTGGIGLDNLAGYVRQPNVLAVGGTWMAPKGLVAAGDFAGIRDICRRSVLAMHGFELAHVGINCAGAMEAGAVANELGAMFSLPVCDKGDGFFVGDLADVVKGPLLGTNGHIGINCNDIDRAKAYFEQRGYSFTEEGGSCDDRGLVSVFFEREVGGFAIQLRRK